MVMIMDNPEFQSAKIQSLDDLESAAQAIDNSIDKPEPDPEPEPSADQGEDYGPEIYEGPSEAEIYAVLAVIQRGLGIIERMFDIQGPELPEQIAFAEAYIEFKKFRNIGPDLTPKQAADWGMLLASLMFAAPIGASIVQKFWPKPKMRDVTPKTQAQPQAATPDQAAAGAEPMPQQSHVNPLTGQPMGGANGHG